MTNVRSPVEPPLPPPRSAIELFGDPVDFHPPWLNPTAFVDREEFDPELYISDLRTFVPLETLRSELQLHLSSLQRELVDLINRDYSDFVSLSTDLIDIDATVVRMRAPLLDVKEKVLAFRAAVDASLGALESQLEQRADANRTREVLELLLDTFHLISKKLIKELPSIPVDWSNGHANSASTDHLRIGISIHHTENSTNLREAQSMLLERIASEMNRLKLYITHAQAVQNMPFIENLEKRIQRAGLLVDNRLGHCFVDALENRDANVVYKCLHAYAAIDNTRNAEEIFRSTMVAPFDEKIFDDSSGSGWGSADELVQDYNIIKQYIEDDCKVLLDISTRESSGLHVFSFMANSILEEVLSAIQKRKPGAFSPGWPKEFLKNYKSSLDFLAYLEAYYCTGSAVAKFRSEAVYVEFMKQWNIGVYFTLRFQEIAGTLDSSLVLPNLLPIQSASSDSNSQRLILKQSTTLLECLASCWRDDVFVISCADKFLRLTVQLLSRYSNWLLTGLAARKSQSTGSNACAKWATSAAVDDFIYRARSGSFVGNVLGLLESCSTEVLDLVKQSIQEGVDSLKDLLPHVMSSLTDTLVEEKENDLRVQLNGLSATNWTSKLIPTRHSSYVSGLLRPIKTFLEGESANAYLREDIKNDLLQRAAIGITGRYDEMATKLVKGARETELSLQKMRSFAQRRVGASSDVPDNNVTCTDKICMQLFLDIQEYGRNLASLGVEADSISAYRSLWQHVAPADRQDSISF